jgi:YD repeat-containing protein
MNLEKKELKLNDGATARYEYDRDGDLLEIIFRSGEATSAVELTESIVLRFDWEASEPLSLSFISFSRLLQANAYGEMHFELLQEEWPDEVRDKIFPMLRQAPLSDFIKLGGYAPAHTQQIIPLATIRQPYLMPQAA